MTVRGNFGHAVKDNGWRYWFSIIRSDVRCYLHRARLVALCRALRQTIGHGYYGELCQVCGRPYILWHAPDDIYQQVIGTSSGLFCPNCFDRMAAKVTLDLRWAPHVFSRVSGDLPTPTQPDLNDSGPDSSVAAGTSIGGDLPKPDEAQQCSGIIGHRGDHAYWPQDVGQTNRCTELTTNRADPAVGMHVSDPSSLGVLPEQPQPDPCGPACELNHTHRQPPP